MYEKLFGIIGDLIILCIFLYFGALLLGLFKNKQAPEKLNTKWGRLIVFAGIVLITLNIVLKLFSK